MPRVALGETGILWTRRTMDRKFVARRAVNAALPDKVTSPDRVLRFAIARTMSLSNVLLREPVR